MPLVTVSSLQCLLVSTQTVQNARNTSPTEMRKFTQIFGLPTAVCSATWKRSVPVLKAGINPKHMRWGLRILKSYDTEALRLFQKAVLRGLFEDGARIWWTIFPSWMCYMSLIVFGSSFCQLKCFWVQHHWPEGNGSNWTMDILEAGFKPATCKLIEKMFLSQSRLRSVQDSSCTSSMILVWGTKSP